MKNIIQNKKIYSKPLLEVIPVDYEISMAMDTWPPGSDGEPWKPKPAEGNGFGGSGPLDRYNPASGSDAFGSDSPQY